MRDETDNRGSSVTRLALVIENRILREVMTATLRKQADLSVIAAMRYSASTYKETKALACDVLLVDHASAREFPSNFIPDLLGQLPRCKVILFGMVDDAENFVQAIRSGVSGYLLGDASAEETIAAVRKVVAGEAVAPARLCQELFQFVARTTREGSMILNQRLCLRLGLTGRQQQLIALLARGFTNKEIAETMKLSEFTVKNHVHRIMRRLNAQSRYAAVQTVCDNNHFAAADYC
jgi:DNA-binding NarL/FixJ family response regulator